VKTAISLPDAIFEETEAVAKQLLPSHYGEYPTA
jgi:hypothetical protein